MNQTTKDVCFGNTKDLAAFKREVFSYRFKDLPNYENLRKLLIQLRDQETQKMRPATSTT